MIVHRPPRFLLWGVWVFLAFAVTGAAVSLRAETDLWVILVWGLLVSLGVVAVFDLRTTRVEMGSKGLTIVKGFRRRFVARVEIESVTWETGAGVSVKLVDGGWVALPEVGPGSQGLANSVRAWLGRARDAG